MSTTCLPVRTGTPQLTPNHNSLRNLAILGLLLFTFIVHVSHRSKFLFLLPVVSSRHVWRPPFYSPGHFLAPLGCASCQDTHSPPRVSTDAKLEYKNSRSDNEKMNGCNSRSSTMHRVPTCLIIQQDCKNHIRHIIRNKPIFSDEPQQNTKAPSRLLCGTRARKRAQPVWRVGHTTSSQR